MRLFLLLFVFLLSNCGKGTSDQFDDIDTEIKAIDTSNIDLSSSIIGVRFLHQNIKGSECERLTHQKYDLNKHIIFRSIKLCSVKKQDDGKVDIIYADSSKFSFNDIEREIMVEIPLIYVKREIQGAYEYLHLSTKQKAGYSIHPAFVENDKILSRVFVGAYDAVVLNNRLRSISNVKATSGLSLNSYRTLAKNNGDGFGVLDMRTVLLLQKLFMIYYADRNSQEKVGMGLVNLYWQTSQIGFATEDFNSSNKITLGTNDISNSRFKVGQLCAVAPTGEYWMDENRIIQSIIVNSKNQLEIEFSGPRVNIKKGVSKIYGQIQVGGGTNKLSIFNGNSNLFNASPQSGLENVRLFYLENLWGNVWNLLDGVIVYNLEYYIGDAMDKYTSDNSFLSTYTKLSYKTPLQDKNTQDIEEHRTAYVSSMGFDVKYPSLSLPYRIGEGASPKDGYCDPFYARGDINEIFIPAFGGGFDHSYRSGLYTLRFFWKPTTELKSLHGARLQFKEILR